MLKRGVNTMHGHQITDTWQAIESWAAAVGLLILVFFLMLLPYADLCMSRSSFLI